MWLFDYLNPKMWKISRDYRRAVKEGKIIECNMKREWDLNWLINCIAPIIGTGIIACLFFADKDSVFVKFTNDYNVFEIFEILCSLLTGMPYGPRIPKMFEAPINQKRFLGQFINCNEN